MTPVLCPGPMAERNTALSTCRRPSERREASCSHIAAIHAPLLPYSGSGSNLYSIAQYRYVHPPLTLT